MQVITTRPHSPPPYPVVVPATLLDRTPRLERRNGLPVHVQIEQWLMEQIVRGELGTGERLPGERTLAAALRVSRMTLRQALDGLARRGVLVRLPGRKGGAFVAEPKIDCDLTGVAGFTEQMRRTHRKAGATVLSARTGPADATIAEALLIPVEAPVHEIVRVRDADGTPLALERSWLPADRVRGLLDHPLNGSLYDLLADTFDLAPRTAVEYLEPVLADTADAAALGIPTGTALMQVERTANAQSGMPVEYARDRYRSDKVRLMIRTEVTA